MADVTMAAHAAQRLIRPRRRIDRLDDVSVTGATGAFGDARIHRRDANRFRERASGEVERMPEPIAGFGCVFADEVVRRVAVVAHRHAAMARSLPAFELLPHDVAIGAGGGIVRQVRAAARIEERVAANAQQQSNCSTHEDHEPAAHAASIK